MDRGALAIGLVCVGGFLFYETLTSESCREYLAKQANKDIEAPDAKALRLIKGTLASDFLLAPKATTFLEERVLLHEGQWWQAFFVVDAPNQFNVPLRQKMCVVVRMNTEHIFWNKQFWVEGSCDTNNATLLKAQRNICGWGKEERDEVLTSDGARTNSAKPEKADVNTIRLDFLHNQEMAKRKYEGKRFYFANTVTDINTTSGGDIVFAGLVYTCALRRGQDAVVARVKKNSTAVIFIGTPVGIDGETPAFDDCTISTMHKDSAGEYVADE